MLDSLKSVAVNEEVCVHVARGGGVAVVVGIVTLEVHNTGEDGCRLGASHWPTSQWLALAPFTRGGVRVRIMPFQYAISVL